MALSLKIAGATFTKFVGVASTPVLLNTLGLPLTRSGNEAAGYNYTTASGGSAYLSSVKLPAGNSGELITKMTSDGQGLTIIMSPVRTNAVYGTAGNYGVLPYTPSIIRIVANGVTGIVPNVANIPFVSGMLFKITRTGNAWTASVSTDEGVTWVLIHNYAVLSDVDMYPCIQSTGAGTATAANLQLTSAVVV